MAKNNPADASSINLIGQGTQIEGDINSNGDIRIDGSVIGKVNAKGKLVIGPTGTIEGEITCQNADVSGGVKGKITVAELLSLKSSAKISGDIVTNKLAIEPGADFTGSCSMGAVVKEMKYGERKEQPAEEKTAVF